MRKIVVLDTAKKWGGGTSSLLDLLRGLAQGPYSFQAVFYDNVPLGERSDIRRELERLNVPFRTLGRYQPSPGVKLLKEIVRLACFFNRNWRRAAIFHLDYRSRIRHDAARLAHLLQAEKPDLLYLNNQPSENLEGILAARQTGTRVIQHVRASVGLSPTEARLTNAHVSRLICVSEGAREALLRSGVRPALCTVVYNGIDLRRQPECPPEELRRQLGLQPEQLAIGTVGYLMPGKRVHLLLEAFARISSATPEARCLVVGAGPERHRLDAVTTHLGLHDRVLFTGFREDAFACIGTFDVFALPSRSEGLPRVVLEAMLLSKPVVAFDIPGVRELVVDGKTGFLVPEGDVAGFAKRLEQLAADPGLRAEMGRLARVRVEQFSIQRSVTGVSDVFAQVLNLNAAGDLP